jgi:uncharacterized protein
MTISMYKASAPIFLQFLNSLSAVLDKAAAHAEEKKIDPSIFVSMRLYPDMFSLARQVRQATTHAVGACARTAGVEPPALPEAEATFADLKSRIAAAISFIETLEPEQIDGSEDRHITLTTAAGTREFNGQTYLLNFCLPHFYFHVTTAYDILRHAGVPLAKRDFMGSPIQR